MIVNLTLSSDNGLTVILSSSDNEENNLSIVALNVCKW